VLLSPILLKRRIEMGSCMSNLMDGMPYGNAPSYQQNVPYQGQYSPYEGQERGVSGPSNPQNVGQGGFRRPGANDYGQQQLDPQIVEWFRAVDTDRSGSINAQELQSALSNGDWTHFSEESCRIMVSLYDKNGSGCVDINEFQDLFRSMTQWQELFQRYDKDRSGSIEKEDLGHLFQDMGYRFSPMFVEKLINKYAQKTKRLNLDNFIVISVQVRQLTDGFRTRDRERQARATFQFEEFIGLAMGIFK